MNSKNDSNSKSKQINFDNKTWKFNDIKKKTIKLNILNS
jgi:hypothetical protein